MTTFPSVKAYQFLPFTVAPICLLQTTKAQHAPPICTACGHRIISITWSLAGVRSQQLLVHISTSEVAASNSWLNCLQAQAGLMSGLNSQQRRQLYAMVSDDTLAGMLVAMRPTERTKLLQEAEQLDPTLVDRVLRYIRSALHLLRGHASSCLHTFQFEKSESSTRPCCGCCCRRCCCYCCCCRCCCCRCCCCCFLQWCLLFVMQMCHFFWASGPNNPCWTVAALQPVRMHDGGLTGNCRQQTETGCTSFTGYGLGWRASGWLPCHLMRLWQKQSR